MFVTEDAFEAWEARQKRGWSRWKEELNVKFGEMEHTIEGLRQELNQLRAIEAEKNK